MNIGKKFRELLDLVIGSHFGSNSTMTVVHDLILYVSRISVLLIRML